jgi:FtsP/CotA-like multicopper oxidase with cupredoxin domain
VLLAPGARAEFLVTTPPEGVFAQFVTLGYDTGPNGEITPERVLSNLFSTHDAPVLATRLSGSGPPLPASQTSLAALKPVRTRRLYFSEERVNPTDPTSPITYFLTVEGKTPKAFDMNFQRPDVIARQGTVEDWVIENRAVEAHAFHIHQVHFQVLERDGKSVDDPTLRDTIDLPYWDGKSRSYPSIKLRIDFRGSNVVGTFLYHCHILEHEDGGMMGAIRVLPAAPKK